MCWVLLDVLFDLKDMAGKVAELMKMVEGGARYGNIQLEDVEKVLSDESFISGGMMTTTENGAVSWCSLTSVCCDNLPVTVLVDT